MSLVSRTFGVWWPLLFAVACVSDGNDLVGPQSGGPLGMLRGHQHARYARGPVVTEHPLAFFISGSTIPGLNGLYKKGAIDPMLNRLQHHRYEQSGGNWSLLYVDCTIQPYNSVGGLRTEWVLVDPSGRDRLAHAGDCLIPRPGTAWRHVHRPQFGRLVLGATATTFHDSDWDPTVWLADDVVTITEVATADDRMEVRVHRTDRKVRTDGWRIRVGHNTSSAHGDVADTQGQPDNDTDDDGDVASSRSAGSAVAKPSPSHANSGGDGGRDGLDDDELPWQVLALLSQWSIDECERKLREFDERLREEVAKLEHTLPQSPDVWPMPAESSQSAPQAHFVPPLTPAEATTACLDERVDDVIAELSKQLVSTPPGRTAVLLHTQLAECLRRAGQPAQALEDARASLALAPSFGPALLQHALALLDLGNTTAAIRALESVLGVWPSAPGLDRLLVQAHARARRARVGPVYAEFRVGDRAKTREDVEGFWSEGESVDVIGLGPPTAPISVRLVSTGRVIAVQPDHLERVGETSKTEGAEDSAASNDNGGDDGDDASLSRNHYVVLGLPVDFSAAQLRDAYKRLSRAHHPDREGGSTTVFQAVAEAHALLSDPSRREEYDLGVDLPSSGRTDAPTLRDEVNMRYFPLREVFKPYGDPLQIRKDEMARRIIEEEHRSRMVAEQEQRRAREEINDVDDAHDEL